MNSKEKHKVLVVNAYGLATTIIDALSNAGFDAEMVDANAVLDGAPGCLLDEIPFYSKSESLGGIKLNNRPYYRRFRGDKY